MYCTYPLDPAPAPPPPLPPPLASPKSHKRVLAAPPVGECHRPGAGHEGEYGNKDGGGAALGFNGSRSLRALKKRSPEVLLKSLHELEAVRPPELSDVYVLWIRGTDTLSAVWLVRIAQQPVFFWPLPVPPPRLVQSEKRLSCFEPALPLVPKQVVARTSSL